MTVPDYYQTLGITHTARHEDILQAYQRLALVHHPDYRSTSESDAEFVMLADAFYTLSSPDRRAEYDLVRKRDAAQIELAVAAKKITTPEELFLQAMEPLIRTELEQVGWVWRVVGGVSGACLGFIMANIPGAAVGAVVGGQLGEIRDKKGKSCYEVFYDLSSDQRKMVLIAIAKKLLT